MPFHQKFDKENTFFLGCTHINHKNICSATTQWTTGYRNFDSLDSMNESIIKSINDVVEENQTLFLIGDTLFGDKTLLPIFRNKIRCKNIHYIYGNHCDFIRKNIEYQKYFTSCSEYLEIFCGKKLVTIFHYPILSWRDMSHGSYMIHSHCHGNLNKEYIFGRRIDVGWDCFNKPVSFLEIETILKNRDIVLVDHHNSNTNRS